jgi:hypothetical protein
MKPIGFVVESVRHVKGRPLVLARQVDAGDFRQSDGLRLGGYKVVGFDMPRALAADGSPRRDLFGFWLDSDPAGGLAEGASLNLTDDNGGAQ